MQRKDPPDRVTFGATKGRVGTVDASVATGKVMLSQGQPDVNLEPISAGT